MGRIGTLNVDAFAVRRFQRLFPDVRRALTGDSLRPGGADRRKSQSHKLGGRVARVRKTDLKPRRHLPNYAFRRSDDSITRTEGLVSLEY